MQKVIHHVERIKAKPHHIRKKVAFSIAAGVAGLVAFVWLSASLATGAFAIQGSNFAQSVGGGATVETVEQGTSQLAGAAAALDRSEPRIQIVSVTPTTTPAAKNEETTIPF
jgi:hypothetical protein